MRRIGVIAPTPFFSDRGCHVRILGVMKALQELGNEVVLCTYHLGRDVAGIETHRSLRIPWYRKTSAGPSVHKFYMDLLLLGTCARAFASRPPDLLFASLHEGGFVGGLYKRFRNIPMIVDIQGSLTDECMAHRFLGGNRAAYRILGFLERESIRRADAVTVSSPMVADLLRERRMALPERIHLVPDGVDTAHFTPAADKARLREELGLPTDTTIIVFTGVLTEYQGVDILLRAAAKIGGGKGAPFFLILGYPDVEKYRAMAAGLGLGERTRFTGRVDYQTMIPRYLAASDIAVSPKMHPSEANLKLLDYMAAGLPAVVFDTPVNRRVLGDDGIYARPGDEDSYAAALDAALGDPAGAAERGSRLRKRAEDRFSWRAIGRTIMEIYRGIVMGMFLGLLSLPAGEIEECAELVL
ncbi:MAG: glycosyltransferase family 4 protein [Chlamydiota bacterium]